MPDITAEIKFKTARSGGKGGQNVNKVESMVEGYWNVDGSQLFSENEKQIIKEKLVSRLNADGFVLAKSQVDRSQLGNKKIVIKKLNNLVAKALVVRKKRKPTKPSKDSKEKRLQSKKIASEKKEFRKKIKE